MENSKEVVKVMKEVQEAMDADMDLWVEKDNKAAGARVRKATLELAKLGKTFRKMSVQEAKA